MTAVRRMLVAMALIAMLAGFLPAQAKAHYANSPTGDHAHSLQMAMLSPLELMTRAVPMTHAVFEEAVEPQASVSAPCGAGHCVAEARAVAIGIFQNAGGSREEAQQTSFRIPFRDVHALVPVAFAFAPERGIAHISTIVLRV